MTIKVNNRHRTVSTINRPQQGEGDGMVASQGDDPRQRLAVLGRAGLLGVCLGGPGEDAVVAFLDLVQGVGVVVRCHGDVAAVEHGRPAVEGVCFEGDVVAAAFWLLVERYVKGRRWTAD
jgi:hypothetical protein